MANRGNDAQMTGAYEESALFRRTLGVQESVDNHADAREKLREAYKNMRQNVAALVGLIPQDCHQITVHDITHLDALWEIGDLICGPDFAINPAEAFVFGGAVLLHDAGMCIPAFSGGISEIRKSTEWVDCIHAICRRHGIGHPPPDMIIDPPEAIQREVLFNVLRMLHAKQAEKLISTTWRVPSTGQEMYLLEDHDLRNFLGGSIGKVAHSHHWDVDRLATELRPKIGAASGLPGDWTVNEIKVACLLRCADAAHIDHRRAPSMLYALTRPSGDAAHHWDFQNQLNKPTVQSGLLLYSSGRDFDLSQASAWWLCYDTLKMIDKELSTSNALLQEMDVAPLAVSRVVGVDSPRILSRHIVPSGWHPVDTEVKVSNPVALAETLGGENLYGSDQFVPIRELLQNAADAVRARRRLEDRNIKWGKIRITLDPMEGTANGTTWLHVDDTGVGMSERILLGPLIDFGQSIWNSPLLREEFPGLESKGINPVGKFGIGFFSVFLLGPKVSVITRPYTAGVEETRTLEFGSLSSRPILRLASDDELPKDYSTRISMEVQLSCIGTSTEGAANIEGVTVRGDDAKTKALLEVLRYRVRTFVSSLDIEVEVQDHVQDFRFVHDPDWKNAQPSVFLADVIGGNPTVGATKSLVTAHEHLVRDICDEEGNHFGRAALNMFVLHKLHVRSSRFRGRGECVSVGGFAYPPQASHGRGVRDFHYIGVMNGDAATVARDRGKRTVAAEHISRWASAQAAAIDQARFGMEENIRACHTIVRLGGDSGELPFCFCGGEFLNVTQFENAIMDLSYIHVLLNGRIDNFSFSEIGDLDLDFFTLPSKCEFVVVGTSGAGELFSDEYVHSRYGEVDFDVDLSDLDDEVVRESSFDLLLGVLKSVWLNCRVRLEHVNVFSDTLFAPPRENPVLTISQVNDAD